MKKILSFLLVMCILVSAICLVPVSAESDDYLTQSFYNYCLEKAGTATVDENAQVRIIERREVDMHISCFTATGFEEPADMEVNRIIGDFCVHTNATYYPYDLGIYVYAHGEILDLETAYENGLVNLGSLLGFDGVYVHNIGKNKEYVELEHICTEAFAKYNPPTEKGDYIDCIVYGETDKVVVFRADVRNTNYMYPYACSEQRIGGYLFIHGYVYGPKDNPTGLYVLYKEQVIPAITAYEEGIIRLDDLVSMVGAEKVENNYGEIIAEKLNLRIVDGMDLDYYIYQEIYAHFNNPSPYSAMNPDYLLVFASSPVCSPAFVAGRVGDYVVGQYSIYYPHKYGFHIYIPETEEVYTLEEAVEAKVEGIEQAFLHLGDMAGIIGDVDRDRRITIKDATAIQKDIAGIAVENRYDNETGVAFYIFDYDRDDEVNIKDATAIQKYIAGIKDNTAS